MKMVSGSVVSSKPVSLPKAARILLKFASSDNGASPAFGAYLKRASASFNELVQLHKEFKGSGYEHKGKKHLFSGSVTEVIANNVKELTGLQCVEKRDSNQRKRHKRGKGGEGEDRELDHGVKIDDEEPTEKKRTDKGSVDGNVSGDGKKLESNDAIVDLVMVADVSKNDNETIDRGRDSKKKKNRDRGMENIVALVKIGKEEQASPPDRTASIGKTSEIEKQDLSEETKKKKKKKNRGKGGKENFDAVMIETEEEYHHGQNGSNKKLSEIDKEDGSEEMKVEKKKKKRHGGENKKSDSLIDIEKEEQHPPPDQNDGNKDATELVENDGDKQKKHKKMKKSKEDRERGLVVVGDVVPRNPSDGGVENEHEAETINNHVKIKSGEGKKHGKIRNLQGKEREIGSGVEMEAANEELSRKRKHKGDAIGGLDESEEQHKPKKKKTKT